MASIRIALSQVKAGLFERLQQHVKDVMASLPGDRRDRQLDPLKTILLFIIQVINGNTAILHLPHLGEMTASAPAYCKARKRLPLALFPQLFLRLAVEFLPTHEDTPRWRGHRVWRADGTSFSMPDRPVLQAYFGQSGGQKSGCGFPVATLFVLTNSAGLIVDTVAAPLRTHDGSQLHKLFKQMSPGDVLVYDRAGCSYVNFALLFMRNLHGIIRLHQRQTVSFRPRRKHAGRFAKGKRKGKPTSHWIRRLGRCDQLVRWIKPASKPKWMAPEEYAALPESLELREMKYTIKMKGFRTKVVTLVTTLTDPNMYPASELAEQYNLRWQIEVDFRNLKQTMKMDVLKCQTVDGVLKELAVFTLVYNLVRMVMLQASRRQKVPPDRISFIDALRWLQAAGDGRELADLVVNRKRPGRFEPRVIKRRKDRYPIMTRPREELRQAILLQGVMG